MSKQRSIDRQEGFTVVELMVATLIFSVILTVITMGVLSFSNRYYKAVNASTTQNTTRTVIDTITQAIQFGSAQVVPSDPSKTYFCAGGNVFMFDDIPTKYTGVDSQMGLYMTPMDGEILAGSSCHSQDRSGGRQLLGENMRLTNLSVAMTAPNVYKVSIAVAYGDTELLCAPSLASKCTAAANYAEVDFRDRPDTTCKPFAGSQFCAASSMTTMVSKRLTN